ncbi:P-loop containing nucleoside triphosphate hydrolase protein, partial [Immersiella caudata]
PTMPIFKEVHMVYCRDSNRNCFHDEPRIFKGDLMSDHLRGLQGIENITTHLDRHPNIAFAVLNAYNCFCKGGPDYQRLVGYKNGRVLNDSPTAKPITKYVLFNKSLGNALHRITQEHKDSFPGLKGKPRWHCEEPFMLYYVYNKAFLKLCHSAGLDDFDRESVIMVCNWFEENKRKVWDETDELLARGKITFDHYARLFRPGELVIYSEADSFGTVVASRVKPHTWDYDTGLVLVEHWTFSGNFQREIGKVSLATMLRRGGEAITQLDGEVDITDLEVYPLRFAKPELRDQLIARGNRFWRSRKKCLVSYEDPEIESKEVEKPIERRMMIDYNMFRRMHPSNFIFMRYHDDLGSEAMNKEEPPSDEFLATLPPRIHAFDFGSKSWRLIRVDRITDVTWNKEAFKRLVVPEVTKELIQAAVMAHGYHLSPSPDIIAEKGQGLLILLHGGPGTGKTLTAESIAETQERPLYRITCGDVGIEPTTVEKYLNSVLAIGKAWGCVVLLDEADVFLEERTVTDQKQNAIVSVFLRALEYYDGILILTTNRVGTFDEAFKSRIHLAIRYTQLDEDQRVEIWRNFIRMLSKTKERVDTNDLERNIPKLAQVELNGRQIRNVITLARYLARFRKQMLVYQHVQDAFASVVKFDEYLLEL